MRKFSQTQTAFTWNQLKNVIHNIDTASIGKYIAANPGLQYIILPSVDIPSAFYRENTQRTLDYNKQPKFRIFEINTLDNNGTKIFTEVSSINSRKFDIPSGEYKPTGPDYPMTKGEDVNNKQITPVDTSKNINKATNDKPINNPSEVFGKCWNLFEPIPTFTNAGQKFKLKDQVKRVLMNGWEKIRNEVFQTNDSDPVGVIKKLTMDNPNEKNLWFLCATCKAAIFSNDPQYNYGYVPPTTNLPFADVTTGAPTMSERELHRFLIKLHDGLSSLVQPTDKSNPNDPGWKWSDSSPVEVTKTNTPKVPDATAN